MKKHPRPRQRQIYWGIKLHLETAEIDNSQQASNKEHVVLRIEGKRRPILILREPVEGRYGKKIVTVAYVTTKNFDTCGRERNDLVPFSYQNGTISYAEEPTRITENLIDNYDKELHPQLFSPIIKKLSALRAQSWRQGERSIQES